MDYTRSLYYVSAKPNCFFRGKNVWRFPRIKPHSFRPCSSPDGQGLFLFHGLVNCVFLSSLFPIFFRSKWKEKGSFPSFFLLFSFWGGEGAGDRKNEVFFLFPLFFLSFCFFSFFFSFPFPSLEGKWEWEGVGIFPLLFLVLFLIMEKKWGEKWKWSEGISSYFSS